MFQFGFNMFPEIPRPFNTNYRCFSVSMLPGNERQDVERGGKIIMPPSALDTLTRLNINYPMLFKLTNNKTSRITHSGVLEFVADEGRVYLPLWMMHNLLLEEGDFLQIESVSLPVATFSRFQPQSTDFLDITNPKAVLENGLRNFACLTTGDMIAIMYNQKIYELCVLETKPGNAVSIIECDMNVEFAPPVDYKEPEKPKKADEAMNVDPTEMMPEPAGFVAFSGQGNRLDGKRRKDSTSSEPSTSKTPYVRGIPDYDYKLGTVKFLRKSKPPQEEKELASQFIAFQGPGFSLRRPIPSNVVVPQVQVEPTDAEITISKEESTMAIEPLGPTVFHEPLDLTVVIEPADAAVTESVDARPFSSFNLDYSNTDESQSEHYSIRSHHAKKDCITCLLMIFGLIGIVLFTSLLIRVI